MIVPTNLDFEEQILALQSSLMLFAVKLTGNNDDAEDLLQETILKAIRNKSKYVSNINLKGWLFTIMRNIFINEYRRNSACISTVDIAENAYYVSIRHTSGFSSPENAYTLNEIENVIDRFNDKYRIPFTMHVAGYKYKEIADKMNLPIGTVKSRIFFARKLLCKILKEYRYKM